MLCFFCSSKEVIYTFGFLSFPSLSLWETLKLVKSVCPLPILCWKPQLLTKLLLNWIGACSVVLSQLTVSKDFSLSLDVPSHLIRGEEIVLEVNIINHLEHEIEV